MTATITEIETTTFEELFPYEDSNDPNAKAHIVRGEENDHVWIDGMTVNEMVDVARMAGKHLVALCGHTWVPKLNPEKHDVCKTCIKIWERVVG